MADFRPPGDPYTREQSEHWVPRVRTGHYYVNDRSYYLYSEKETKTLGDITCLVFELAEVPIPGSVSVRVEGITYSNFVVEANRLILKLDDQESFASLWALLEQDASQWGFILNGFSFGPSNEVVVTYDFLDWSTGSAGYSTLTGTEVHRIKNADEIKYVITEQDTQLIPAFTGVAVPTGFVAAPPVDGAPVVLTDDCIEYGDQRGFQTEFALDYATAELTFNAARNFVQNPAYKITSTGIQYGNPTYEHPLEWEVVEPTSVILSTSAYYGANCYQLTGTGLLMQTVDLEKTELLDKPWSVSAFTTDGTAQLTVNFIDSTGGYLDADGAQTGGQQPDYSESLFSTTFGGTDWTRGTMTFGEPALIVDDTASLLTVPDNTTFAEIKLERVSGTPCVDAIQLEEGYSSTQFEPLDPNITVEYETSTSGFWVPDPSGEIPFEVNQLDMNPLNVPNPGGYLFAEEFSNVDDFQLGVGGFSTDPVSSPTGVVEVTGSLDAILGRRDLPYAKTSGFTKLRQRKTFHLDNPSPLFDISDLTIENGNPNPVPASLAFTTTENTFLLTGVPDPVLRVIPDSRIEVRLDAYVEDQFENPAFVFEASVVAASGTIFDPRPTTSHSGQIPIRYQPPDVTGATATGDLGEIDSISVTVGTITDTLRVHGYRGPGLDFDGFLS
jgi:hypothetical protein